MNNQEQARRYKPSIHIEFYFWVAWLLANVGLALLISLILFIRGETTEPSVIAVALFGVFFALYQYSCRRCSSDNLSVRDGLRYVAAYTTIGVSGLSLFLAVLSTLMAIVITEVIAIISFFESNSGRAPRRFYAVVAWFGRHRMYP